MQLDTIMGRSCRFNHPEPDEAANSVIDMNDKIARCQTGSFGNKVLSPNLLFGTTDEAIAKNILFTDDNKAICLKSGFDTPDGERGFCFFR